MMLRGSGHQEGIVIYDVMHNWTFCNSYQVLLCSDILNKRGSYIFPLPKKENVFKREKSQGLDMGFARGKPEVLWYCLKKKKDLFVIKCMSVCLWAGVICT